MLDALVSGTTDPEVLAELARGKLRKKIPALREALEGRFDRMHALWIGAILAHIDFLDEQIEQLTGAIGEQIAPFEQAVELLCTITGVQPRTAEAIIAEIGIDVSIFPTAKELASWAGQCPGNDQSAGKRRSGKTRKGSKCLDWALEEAALAATRSKDTYLAAQYARLRPRRGHKKAHGAVKHSITVALLAPALHRRALQRPRRRLLPAPRSREDHQAPRRPARTPRPRRHASGGRRRMGRQRDFPVSGARRTPVTIHEASARTLRWCGPHETAKRRAAGGDGEHAGARGAGPPRHAAPAAHQRGARRRDDLPHCRLRQHPARRPAAQPLRIAAHHGFTTSSPVPQDQELMVQCRDVDGERTESMGIRPPRHMEKATEPRVGITRLVRR
jgi:hypothetical protein